MNGQNKQRDRPGFWGRWGADVLLVVGAAVVAAGIAMIYVPAGVIAGGLAFIAGGFVRAVDGGDAG